MKFYLIANKDCIYIWLNVTELIRSDEWPDAWPDAWPDEWLDEMTWKGDTKRIQLVIMIDFSILGTEDNSIVQII